MPDGATRTRFASDAEVAAHLEVSSDTLRRFRADSLDARAARLGARAIRWGGGW